MKITRIIIGFLIASVLLGGIAWISFGLHSMWESITPNTKFSVIGVSATLLLGIASHHFTRKREIEARHFERKAQVYADFINFVFQLFQVQKGLVKNFQPNEMIKNYMDAKKEMLVWAGPKMIREWNSFEKNLKRAENPQAENLKDEEVLDIFDGLIRSIRKDLGQKDRLLQKRELANFVMKK